MTKAAPDSLAAALLAAGITPEKIQAIQARAAKLKAAQPKKPAGPPRPSRETLKKIADLREETGRRFHAPVHREPKPRPVDLSVRKRVSYLIRLARSLCKEIPIDHFEDHYFGHAHGYDPMDDAPSGWAWFIQDRRGVDVLCSALGLSSIKAAIQAGEPLKVTFDQQCKIYSLKRAGEGQQGKAA